MNPGTFDRLVAALEDDPVFSNNSHNPQMPVEKQVAITLYRFGRNGNGASLEDIANWAGVGKGTVINATTRVMRAATRGDFVKSVVQFPTEQEKEEEKQWVEKHSCRAWRNGLYLVDGTLIPIFGRPYWYGECYFDRKCNYSLNIQVSTV